MTGFAVIQNDPPSFWGEQKKPAPCIHYLGFVFVSVVLNLYLYLYLLLFILCLYLCLFKDLGATRVRMSMRRNRHYPLFPQGPRVLIVHSKASIKTVKHRVGSREWMRKRWYWVGLQPNRLSLSATASALSALALSASTLSALALSASA